MRIKDLDILWLLKEVIDSFPLGIPLGNLTSQVFANIYMNELDQFMKNKLKIKHYLRYADDFVILSINKNDLNHLIKQIKQSLQEKLKLELHPKKIILRKLDWGIDFLGYIVLPHHILPRTKNKKRMFKKLKEKMNELNFNQYLQSYLGYLSHANAYKVREELINLVGFLHFSTNCCEFAE